MAIVYVIVGFVMGFSFAALILGENNANKKSVGTTRRKNRVRNDGSRLHGGRTSSKGNLPKANEKAKASSGKSVQVSSKDKNTSRKKTSRKTKK
jgi:hypothetical protein